MNKPMFRLLSTSVAALLLLVTAVSAQDFKKSYQLSPGGLIRVGNISGNVTVTGYDGSEVIVTAIKKGEDRDLISVKDESSAGVVDVAAKYPRTCNCDASIDFRVQVPRSMAFDFERISSVSGNVEIRGVTGKVEASTVSGDVQVNEVSGSVSASSVSGSVEVEVSRLGNEDDMKFSSVSGDVRVRVPANLGADVNMSSFSGTIKTDFPLEVRAERYSSKSWARGKIGDGSRNLNMTSVSGSLSLLYSSN
ncbi:MAG TPA: DUF4097 family beta strand repeat-containing protein [Blastocatellia bacterium]|nr:DUF4097 family beta strand repeat-containing protein [Blastocatellia bacterium]